MKQKTVLFILLIMSVVAIKAEGFYYYFKGERIDLTLDRSCLNIIVDQQVEKAQTFQSAFSQLIPDEGQDVRLNPSMQKLRFKTLPNETDYEHAVSELKKNEHIKHVFPFLKKNDAYQLKSMG